MGTINFDDYIGCPYCGGTAEKVFLSDGEGYYCNTCDKMIEWWEK